MNAALVAVALAVAVASPFVTPHVTRDGPHDAAPVAARVDLLDAALDGDRSVLSFLPEDVRSGRFTFRVKGAYPQAPPAPRWSGVFWRTADGNVYTRSEPYDADLVRREVRPLADRQARDRGDEGPSAERMPMDPALVVPLSTGTFYEGSEFQWPLYDVVAPLLEPRVGLTRYSKHAGCRAAMTAHAKAARDAVNALTPRFEPAGKRERWSFDVPSLRRATEAETARAVRECGEEGESPYVSLRDTTRVEVERWVTGVSVRLLLPDGTEAEDYEGDPAVTVVDVRPGPVGPPPLPPDPAPRDALLVNDFLRAVAACGALPWEFSNFMAGNSFTPPSSRSYDGPTIFTTEWVCERDVPPRERASALEKG